MTEQTASKVPQIRFKGFEGEWEERRLGTVCAIGDADHWMPETTSHGIPYVMTGDFCGINEIDFKNAKLISLFDFEKLSRKIKPELGDILFARYASIGSVRYIDTDRKFIASYSCAILKRNNYFNSEYLFFLLQSDKIQNQLKQSINTGSQGNIGIESLKQLATFFPEKTEQTQIGEYFRELERLIGLHQRKHDKLVTLKKAMLQKMFPQHGATTPKIRFKGFSGDWKKEKLGTISDSYSGGTPSVGNRTYYGGDIPFIRSAEINAISTELTITEIGLRYSAAKMVSEGDILYALYGATSGEVGISQINGAINQAVLAIKPHSGYSSQFIATWLRNRKVEIIGTYLQGGQGNLSGAIVKSLHVDLPCIEEQQKIGTYFRTLDSLISKHAIQLQKLKQIKSACLEKMFV